MSKKALLSAVFSMAMSVSSFGQYAPQAIFKVVIRNQARKPALPVRGAIVTLYHDDLGHTVWTQAPSGADGAAVLRVPQSFFKERGFRIQVGNAPSLAVLEAPNEPMFAVLSATEGRFLGDIG